MVGDPFNLESKGSVRVNTNFLRRGVSAGSFGGTRTRMLTMSTMIVSEELNVLTFFHNVDYQYGVDVKASFNGSESFVADVSIKLSLRC